MKHFMLVVTCGFQRLEGDVQDDVIRRGNAEISVERDFLVFDPEQSKDVVEDEGRTLHIAYPRLSEKVYVKLDDYGDAETLSENVGREVGTQYVATYMLAHEY